MSQPNPGNANTPANSPQASSQALLDELHVAADRAREERLKLARMVKQTQSMPVAGGGVPVAQPMGEARIAGLSEQVQRLEEAVASKLSALDQAQEDIESRTQYLESLRHTITETTGAFMNQVEQAQHFKAHVDAAKKHVRMSAGRVAEEVRQQLTDYEGPIADRVKQLNELDQQIDKRIARMQQMHKQANEAVDKHLLSALRTAKEQAAELITPVKQEVDKYLEEQRAKLDEGISGKIAELDVDVEEALKPLTQKFDEVVAEAHTKVSEVAKGLDPLTERIAQIVADGENKAELFAETIPDQLETEMKAQLDLLRDKIVEQTKSIIDGVDEETMEQAGRIIHENIAKGLDQYLTEAEQQAGGYVDSLIARLESAREEAGEHVEQYAGELAAVRQRSNLFVDEFATEISEINEGCKSYAADLAKRLESVRDQHIDQYRAQIEDIETDCSYDRQQTLGQLETEVGRVKHLADERLEHATKLVEEAADTIHARAAAAVDAALKHADQKLDEYEASSVDHLRAIDDGIEHGIEQSRKRVGEHMKTLQGIVEEQEGQARKQGEEAVRAVEIAIAAAQERISGFETGVTQRVALANSTVDDALDSVDQRIHRVEQQATAKVMQIVDLAETSAQGIAESVDLLSKNAAETAAKAQQDLESKLAAFEEISAEALKQSESTLRNNISELRDSSRAMIEVVSRQVKAQASEIEPQTHEVIAQAEQTMRRRVSELRDAAQCMVDIAVSRLESQLDGVKAKAQQTAFKGIDGQGETPASDAA